MLKSTIYKLGASPKRSGQFFLYGLIIFWIGAAISWFGSVQASYLFYLGLSIVIPAFISAMYGYIGILANRYSQVLSAADKIKKQLN